MNRGNEKDRWGKPIWKVKLDEKNMLGFGVVGLFGLWGGLWGQTFKSHLPKD